MHYAVGILLRLVMHAAMCTRHNAKDGDRRRGAQEIEYSSPLTLRATQRWSVYLLSCSRSLKPAARRRQVPFRLPSFAGRAAVVVC